MIYQRYKFDVCDWNYITIGLIIVLIRYNKLIKKYKKMFLIHFRLCFNGFIRKLLNYYEYLKRKSMNQST